MTVTMITFAQDELDTIRAALKKELKEQNEAATPPDEKLSRIETIEKIISRIEKYREKKR